MPCNRDRRRAGAGRLRRSRPGHNGAEASRGGEHSTSRDHAARRNLHSPVPSDDVLREGRPGRSSPSGRAQGMAGRIGPGGASGLDGARGREPKEACGIAGCAVPLGDRPNRKRLMAMRDAMAHRGPDGSGGVADRRSCESRPLAQGVFRRVPSTAGHECAGLIWRILSSSRVRLWLDGVRYRSS